MAWIVPHPLQVPFGIGSAQVEEATGRTCSARHLHDSPLMIAFMFSEEQTDRAHGSYMH